MSLYMGRGFRLEVSGLFFGCFLRIKPKTLALNPKPVGNGRHGRAALVMARE